VRQAQLLHRPPNPSTVPRVARALAAGLGTSGCFLGQLHDPMVVAVIAMGMVQSSVHQIIRVIGVRYPFMTTTWTMLVRASRLRSALHRVGRAHRNDVLVNMVPMHVVQMTVMQIIDMTIMPNRHVQAVGSMLVGMIGMVLFGTGGHYVSSFSSVASKDHYFSEACSKAF
jgi:hypothetical protein